MLWKATVDLILMKHTQSIGCKDMRFEITEEEKIIIDKIKPWLGHHAQLKDDAPREIKDMQLAYS